MTKEQKEIAKREREWQAQDDARIMAQYQDILADKARLNRAVKEATKQTKELEKRVASMKKVAKKKK